MTELAIYQARVQQPFDKAPFDRWISPAGDCMAEFHRMGTGVLVRFPEEADFEIPSHAQSVSAWPATPDSIASVPRLMANAIEPMLGNHNGEIFLHGSAVCLDESAIAFLGVSRSGKTTMAASFAKAGYSLISEDTIKLEREGGCFRLCPRPSAIRVFGDTAAYLSGDDLSEGQAELKVELADDAGWAFAQSPAPLAQIYILDDAGAQVPQITPLDAQTSLASLMPHAFLLDIEDKPRLKAHFERLADLVQDVECFALDFPRRYSQLSAVRQSILDHYQQSR